MSLNLNHPHPGAILHDEVMAPLGLALSELSAQLDVAPEVLAEVMAGNAAITQELAERHAPMCSCAPRNF